MSIFDRSTHETGGLTIANCQFPIANWPSASAQSTIGIWATTTPTRYREGGTDFIALDFPAMRGSDFLQLVADW